ESVRQVAKLKPNQVKIHLLHVIEGTKLAQIYKAGEYTPMDRELYIETVCRALRLLPAETVIGRLTGDGAPDTLLAPDWSRKKVSVINDIDKMMFDRNWFQGDQI
ncbi:MAG: TIGR01212 family radical SAM protein, partial [Clostridia bacterium]|nr:TIGR01212 family radical SAM protein [Clostridia bacterium]